jgi:hypothetical protein
LDFPANFSTAMSKSLEKMSLALGIWLVEAPGTPGCG